MAKSWKLTPNKSIVPILRKSSARGLALAGEHVLGVARDHTPKEEGTLRRSGFVSIDEHNLRAAVSFDTPYAVVQHEDMTLRHTEGGPKYLENALNSERDRVKDIVARTVQGEW